MAVIRKGYLDYSGLQTYDSHIKSHITNVLPVISIDEATETLVFSLGIIIPEEEQNSGQEEP